MDIFAFVGIIVGTTMILGAQAMEGGIILPKDDRFGSKWAETATVV